MLTVSTYAFEQPEGDFSDCDAMSTQRDFYPPKKICHEVLPVLDTARNRGLIRRGDRYYRNTAEIGNGASKPENPASGLCPREITTDESGASLGNHFPESGDPSL
jgi:hypothetical protein